MSARNFKFKSICRWDSDAKIYRLFRATWNRGWNRITIGIEPRLFRLVKECKGNILTIFGLRLHYKHSNLYPLD